MSDNFTIPTTPTRRYHVFLGVLFGLLLALAAGWVVKGLNAAAVQRKPERAFCGLAALLENGKTLDISSKSMGYPMHFWFDGDTLRASDQTSYKMMSGEVCFIVEDKS